MYEEIIEELSADPRWAGLNILAELEACNRWHKRKGVPVRYPESVERWLEKAKSLPAGRTIDLDKLLNAVKAVPEPKRETQSKREASSEDIRKADEEKEFLRSCTPEQLAEWRKKHGYE